MNGTQLSLFENREAIPEEKAKYRSNWQKRGIRKVRTNRVNDINLLRWREYSEIVTDSLWIVNRRDMSGAHVVWYWGNFIPQIPRQMMLRYTKKVEWVLDAFLGGGTTLIECRKLGRNGIGIELNPEVAKKVRELIEKEQNGESVITEVITSDSRTVDVERILDKERINEVQLLILHPPYHDIIRFSDDEKDLSNAMNRGNF